MGEVIKTYNISTFVIGLLLWIPFGSARGATGQEACYSVVVPGVKTAIATVERSRALDKALAQLLDQIFPNLSSQERQDLNRQIERRMQAQIEYSRRLGFFGHADRNRSWESDTIEIINYPDQVSSNGSGGNFRTLNQAISKLQIDLNRLTRKAFSLAVHVLPFFESPLADGGYDVSDYYSVRAALGGIGEFDKFAQTKGYGLVDRKIVIDFIANHTSDQSLEFQRAVRGDAKALEMFVTTYSEPIVEASFVREGVPWKRYLIKLKNGVYVHREARLTFAGMVKDHWRKERLPDGREVWFFHQYLESQLDWNWQNPVVLLKHLDIANFWINRGVSTLRLDAIPFLDKRAESHPRTLSIVEFLQVYLDAVAPHVSLRNEAAVQARELARLSGGTVSENHPVTGELRTRSERARSNYYFPIVPNAFASFFSGNKKYIESALRDLREIDDPSNLNFPSRTHDEVTLETADAEVASINRDHLLFQTYQGLPRGQRFRGENDRTAAGISGSTAAFFDYDANRIRSYFAFYLSLPGQPGFQLRDILTMGNDWQLALAKQAETGVYDSRFINRGYIPKTSLNGGMTDLQRSVYEEWLKVVATRMNLGEVMRRGTLQVVPNSSSNVTTFLRVHGNQRILVIKNISNRPSNVTFAKAHIGIGNVSPTDALTGKKYDLSPSDHVTIQVEADQTIWLNF